jgi:hypothetical protein
MLPSDSPFRVSLEGMSTVLREDVVGLFDISSEDYFEVYDEIKTSIYISDDHKPSYIDRARALLSDPRGEENAHLFFEHLFKETTGRFMDRVLTSAAHMNLIRMMERFEEMGIDFVESRRAVDVLMREFPKDLPHPYILPKEYEVWFKKLFTIVAPIGNMIYDIPHDSAYQLTQILTKLQSSCAGKSHIFAELLRTIGLDAVVSTNKVHGERHKDGIVYSPLISAEHLISGIRLPHGIMVNLDASWPLAAQESLFSSFAHNVMVAFPTRIIKSNARDVFNDPVLDRLYRATNRGFEQYWTIGVGYSIIETAQHEAPFDYCNFAFDQTNFSLLMEDSQARDYMNLLHGYYREKGLYPFDAETLVTLADFMITHREGLAKVLDGDPKGVLHEAVNMLTRADEYNPFYILNQFLMAQVMLLPEFYENPEDLEGGYIAAEWALKDVFRYAVDEIDRTLVREQWISLLENHPSLFVEKYGSLEGVQEKIRQLRQRDIVLANKPSAIVQHHR